MTALAGAWRYADSGSLECRCEDMLQAQVRYGTGPSRCWSEAGVALGRRLTPTLPEDRHDTGVIASRDGRVRLVADIRIDNRQELAGALGMSPADAAVRSDSALLLAAWERWREDALPRIAGDYAVAVWDGERLVLARDFPGQRPLCYWHAQGQMAVASMPCGLLALPEVNAEADDRSLERFARHARPLGDSSYFKDIRRVVPGETITFDRAGMRRTQHWTAPQRELAFARDEDYVEAVRETLDLAVAARLRGAEKGLACHLSAGLDSSAVTATAARLHTGPRPIAAITVMPRRGYRLAEGSGLADESRLAALTSARYETLEHIVVERANRSPLEHFETGFDLFQRPVAEVVNQDWYLAADDAARDRGVAVLLHGQAGNVTFSYGGAERLAALLRQGALGQWWRELHSLAQPGTPLRSLAPFLPRPLWLALARWRGRDIGLENFSMVRREAASTGRFGGRGRDEVDYAFQPRADTLEWRTEALRGVDFGTVNKGLLAGWGIDARDPLADRRLIELTLAIPLSQFARRGEARSLARRVVADRVPREVLAEPRRGHQGADWLDYLTAFRGDIAAETSHQASSAATRFLDTRRMAELIARWPQDPGDPRAARLYRGALMTGLAAGHFARRAGPA